MYFKLIPETTMKVTNDKVTIRELKLYGGPTITAKIKAQESHKMPGL